MKLNQLAWANASALTVALIYVLCALLVGIFPEMFKAVAESWFHGITLEPLWVGAPRPNFILGLVTATVGTWLTGWVFAFLYNKLNK